MNTINTNKYGRFSDEHVIFETYAPIVFTCKDSSGHLFFCVQCSDTVLLLGLTRPEYIIKYLRDEITARAIFESNCSDRLLLVLSGKSYVEKIWDDSLLPDTDSYIASDHGEYDEDIKYYESLCNKTGSIYGYIRVSTSKQDPTRQRRDILRQYKENEISIIEEVYTGTKFQGRDKLNALIESLHAGDTLVFESVSRMSRNAKEGFEMYEELFNKGINLVFLHEPHINTDVYRNTVNNRLDIEIKTGRESTDKYFKTQIEAMYTLMMDVAKEQIKIAFQSAEDEVKNLHYRTKEGLETASINGKQIGQVKGKKLFSEKAEKAKLRILKECELYGGDKTLYQIAKELEITKQTAYRYNKELQAIHVKNKDDFLKYQTELFGKNRGKKNKKKTKKATALVGDSHKFS